MADDDSAVPDRREAVPVRNGFGSPCCPECAEFNSQGCPGHSPFCVTDPYEGLDFEAREILEAIRRYREHSERWVGQTKISFQRLAEFADAATLAIEHARDLTYQASQDAETRRADG